MLSKEGKWLSYFELDSIMKNTKNLDGDINYKLLKAQCSQQILRVLDKNIKGYYKSVQDYKKHPNKYKGKPCLPCYRKRGSEFYLCYTNQSCKIKYGKIVLSKSLSIGIPQYEKYSDLIKDFNQVRIKPLNKGYKVEIIYEVKDTETSKERMDKVSSIDLGIDNLVTLVSEDFTYLFSGKFIKSYNKLFNKTLAKLNSIKDLQKIKGTTKRIKKLYYDREQYIEDVFHKISRKIINLLTNSGITKLIVGYNKGWKQGDVIYKNGVELLVVLSYDHNEPCKGCFFYEDKACGSERLIKCWDCKKEYIFTAIRKYNTTELCGIVKRYEETILKTIKKIEKECQKYVIWDTLHVMLKDDGELIIKALSKDKSVLLNDFIIYINNNGSIDEEDYDLLLTK